MGCGFEFVFTITVRALVSGSHDYTQSSKNVSTSAPNSVLVPQNSHAKISKVSLALKAINCWTSHYSFLVLLLLSELISKENMVCRKVKVDETLKKVNLAMNRDSAQGSSLSMTRVGADSENMKKKGRLRRQKATKSYLQFLKGKANKPIAIMTRPICPSDLSAPLEGFRSDGERRLTIPSQQLPDGMDIVVEDDLIKTSPSVHSRLLAIVSTTLRDQASSTMSDGLVDQLIEGLEDLGCRFLLPTKIAEAQFPSNNDLLSEEKLYRELGSGSADTKRLFLRKYVTIVASRYSAKVTKRKRDVNSSHNRPTRAMAPGKKSKILPVPTAKVDNSELGQHTTNLELSSQTAELQKKCTKASEFLSPQVSKNVSLATTPQSGPIKTLHDHDVVLGRGNGTAALAGNIRFRSFVWESKEAYNQASRYEKSPVAYLVMNRVKALDPPGQFLEMCCDGTFIVAPFEKAFEKTCQALREKKWLSAPSRTCKPKGNGGGVPQPSKSSEKDVHDERGRKVGVGSRVSVFWPLDNTHYAARVCERGEQGWQLLYEEDGEKEWLDLKNHSFVVLS